VAITITEHDGVCTFEVGHKIDPHAVSVQWLPESKAKAIIKRARRDARHRPGRRHGGEGAGAG
jgi:hypothetical protein